MKYQVIDVDGKLWQEFDSKQEADAYVMKLGDRSILARVKPQEDN